MKEKLVKKMKRAERGYNIHRNAHITFNSSKAIIIFILISVGISAFVSFSFNGSYLNANAGGHFLLFIIPLGLLSALSKVILNLIRLIVQLFTLPSYLRYRKRERELFGDVQRQDSGFWNSADVGLYFFIEHDDMNLYSIKFVE